jgi:hypothetical protein
MKVSDDDESLSEGYNAIGTADARPGMIVHIRDEKSRIDRRVMLVLRESKPSFMCLTFCSHALSPCEKDHWRVWSEGTPGEDARLTALEVVLQPHGQSSSKVSIQPCITINTQELWNVENEVPVKLLGEVAPNALRELSKEVKRLFSEKMDEAIPPPRDVPAEQSKGSRDSKRSKDKGRK